MNRNIRFCGHCGAAVNFAPGAVENAASSPTVEYRPTIQVTLNNFVPQQPVGSGDGNKGTYWLPIPSMIIGIMITIDILNGTKWDTDTTNLALVLSVGGLAMAIVSISRQRKGRGMAIAGIVLCSIGLLNVLGRMS